MAGRTRVTYRELDESAPAGGHLREVGVGPEAVIGVHLERGIDLIRAILAIMKAGGGYLPLDPSLPAERLTRMCSQVGPAVVITGTAGAFPVRRDAAAAARRLAADLARRPATAAGSPAAPGQPVLRHLHLGLDRRPQGGRRQYRQPGLRHRRAGARYQVGPDDRVAQVAAMAFDTSVEQVFAALTSGATLTLPPPGTMAPSDLLRGIGRRGSPSST